MATNNYGLTEEEMQELREFAELIGEPLLASSRQRFTSKSGVRTVANRVEQERALEEEIKRVSGLEEVYEPRSRRYTTSSRTMPRKARPEAKKTVPEGKKEGPKAKTTKPEENKVVPIQKRNISHVAGNIENIYEYQMYSDDPIVTMDYDPSRKNKAKKPKVVEKPKKAKTVAKVEKPNAVEKAKVPKKSPEFMYKPIYESKTPQKAQVVEQPLEGDIQNIFEYEALTGDKIIDMDYDPNRSRRNRKTSRTEKRARDFKYDDLGTEFEQEELIAKPPEIQEADSPSDDFKYDYDGIDKSSLSKQDNNLFDSTNSSTDIMDGLHFEEITEEELIAFTHPKTRRAKPDYVKKEDLFEKLEPEDDLELVDVEEHEPTKGEIRKEKRKIKRAAKIEKKEQKKEAKRQKKLEIKRAKGRVKEEQKRRNKNRSIWERIYNLKEYTNGVSDLYYESLDKMPKEEQVGFWKDEIERLEDTRKDYASIQRKLMPLQLGLASVGLCFALGLGYSVINSAMDTINSMNAPKEVQEPTTIITQLSGNKLIYETNFAKKAALVSKDQDYLLERINLNFIPENATEEEMRNLMEEAWEKLEPEVQIWVREPDKVYEAKLNQQKAENEKTKTTQESNTDNTKEDMER